MNVILSCRSVLFLIFCLLTAFSCSESTSSQAGQRQLTLLNELSLDVAEPSGLSFGEDNETLWTVSDSKGKVYQLSLGGERLRTLDFSGEDLEGIAYDSLDNVIWLVEEQQKRIVNIDLSGNILRRQKIYFNTESDDGLEGIAINADQELFVVNEKNPALFLSLSRDLSVEILVEPQLAPDYSDIACDEQAGRFWFLSDEAQALFLWDTGDGLVERFDLPVIKPEGFAIDFKKDEIFVVSDLESRLYHFKIEE